MGTRMMRAPWAVGVVIPARNEERSMLACLNAVLRALDRCRAALSDSWIVVVADSCTDATATLARQILKGRGVVVECCAASPGSARRLGATEVLAHFADIPTSRLWMANTDADTCVAEGWIERQLELADTGCCAVAGIVKVDRIEGLDRSTMHALLSNYVIHDDGTHPHVHGANLGVRADAYLDAGCWSHLTVAEDHCLWSRIRARHWPTSSCSQTVVHTSGRLHGRATGGFADTLREKLELLQARSLACTR